MEDRTTPIEVEELLAQTTWVQGLAAQLVSDPDLCDDIAQRTMLVAFQRRSSIRNLRAWLARVVRNTAIATTRVERRRSEVERATPPTEPTESAEDFVARAELQRRIVGAVLELKEPYRSTVLQRYFGELTAEEIGARAGVPAPTVRSRLKRAIDQLRARFEVGQRKDRGAWLGLLLPKLHSPAAALSAGSALSLGVILMSLKTLLVVLASAGAIVAASLWVTRDRDQGVADPDQGQSPAAVWSPEAVLVDSGRSKAVQDQSEQDLVERQIVSVSRTSLSGRVTDKLTGSPVSVFTLSLWQKNTSEALVRETIRDPQGLFRCSIDQSGVYRLRIRSPGHRTKTLGKLRIVVPDGLSDLEVQLDPGFTVSGRVLDDRTGRPIEGAVVGTSHSSDSSLGLLLLLGNLESRLQEATDADGRFTLTGLAPDNQKIAAVHEEYAEGWQQLDPSHDSLVEIRLKQGAQIFGTAYDDAGQPKEGVWVTLYGTELPLARHVITGPDGSFRTPPLRPGLIQLLAHPPGREADGREADKDSFGFSDEWQVATVEESDLRVDFGTATNLVTWTGTVLGRDGRAQANSSVLLYWKPPSYVGFVRLRGHIRSAECDDRGRFRFNKVPMGRYAVSVRPNDDTKPIVSEIVFDTPGSLEQDIVLESLAASEGSGEIHGVVVDADTDLPITEGIHRSVMAYRIGPAYKGHTSRLDDQGRFRFRELPPGDYSLSTDFSNRPPTDLRVTLAEGQVVRDVRISIPASGQLRLRLTGFPDSAPRKFTVYLEHQQGAFARNPSGQIAENGSWEQTSPRQTGNWLARLVLGEHESIDKPFEMRSGALTEITFRPADLLPVKRMLSLTGSLAWADGTPLAHTAIQFYCVGGIGNLEATDRSKPATTDAWGRFSLEGLRPGQWRIYAKLPGGVHPNFDDLVVRADAVEPLSLQLVVPMGSVSGSLFDRRTGLALGPEEPMWFLFLLDVQRNRAVCELQGGHFGSPFEVLGVPSGDYRLSVMARGYTAFESAVFHHSGTGNQDLGRIELEPCGVLEFQALNAEGQPLSQILVWSNGERVPDRKLEKLPDDKFRLFDLPIGKVKIELSSEGYKNLRKTLTLVPGNKAEARFVLTRPD